MSKKRRLDDTYKELQSSGLPDLWSRIEKGLDMETIKAEYLEENAALAGRNVQKAGRRVIRNGLRRRNFRWKYGAGIASAAVCILLSAQIGRLYSNREQEAGRVAETIAAADGYSAETKHYKPNQMAAQDQAEIAPENSELVQSLVWYSELPVSGTDAAPPPEEAVYASADCLYFTEEVLKQSSALCQVSVEQVSYEKNSNGDIWTVCYDLTVHDILSGGEDLEPDWRLEVRSPLIGTKESNGLYIMKEGGNYLLPLTMQEGGWELAFPYAPQIEQTGNGGYIFHTGWQSLLTEDTVVVMKKRQAPEDYYYDRMVLRQDPEFVRSLVLLAENMQEENRSEEEPL